MKTLACISPPMRIQQMGFSIGGWHPFSGGVFSILTGGTINGHEVFSGGLAGLVTHLSQIQQGIDVSILGPDLGGAVASLQASLDTPAIHLSEWINKHQQVCIIIALIVGAVFLGPLAFAAWEVEAGEAVESAIDLEALGVGLADVGVEAAVDIGVDVAAEVGAGVAMDVGIEAGTEGLGVGLADVGGTAAESAGMDLESLGTIAADSSGADLETLGVGVSDVGGGTAADLEQLGVGVTDLGGDSAVGLGASGTAGTSLTTGGGSTLADTLEKGLINKATSIATGELMNAVLGGGGSTNQAGTIPLGSQSSQVIKGVPNWLLIAGLLGGIFIVADS
jgi:uncharacterized membrane protein YdcZ (DUF606 family)